MNTTETITMIRQTIEHYIKSCNGDIPPIAIYPYGKDGLFVKHILNNQFGIREKYLVDNTLCNYNPEIISSKEMLNKEENITVIISTVSREINKNICEEISKSGSSNFSIINIIDPIIHKADKDDPYYGELKELLRVKAVTGHSFTRIGRLNDGGYAMIDDFSADMKAYSFGISDDMSWDVHISDMTGMKVYMYDHTVPCAPVFHKNCYFNRIGLGAEDDELHNKLSLNTILDKNGDGSIMGKLILKMDIEDAEWDVLDSVSESVLKCFRQMVFEFHGMTDYSENGREKRIKVLRKLNNTHQIVWVHGNNYTYALNNGELTIPYAIEVLYLKKDCYNFSNEKAFLPLSLDMPNMAGRKDFDLSFLAL